MISGCSVSDYSMTWAVAAGQPVPMATNYDGYPHKEVSVDISPWTWRGPGPYLVTFRAKDAQGVEIAQTSVRIRNQSAPQAITTNTPNGAASTTPAPSTVPIAEPPQVRAVATNTTSPALVSVTFPTPVASLASAPAASATEIWRRSFRFRQSHHAALQDRLPDLFLHGLEQGLVLL